MSLLGRLVQRLVAGAKGSSAYRLDPSWSDRQLASILWYRGLQVLRGLPLRLFAGGVQSPIFRGRRVVIEHRGQLRAGPGLILEDGVFINTLSRDGVTLGRNVTIGRQALLVCTGVIARTGAGIRIGDRSAVGAGSFLGGQGGLVVGNDVIMGPGVRIFTENHNVDLLDVPIREQGETRRGVQIGDDCWIGAGVIIVDGVTIGSGCVVAAGAVVTRDLAGGTVCAGVPARVIRTRGIREPAERALQGVRGAAMDSRARILSSRDTE